jgi:RHS repeat-associated protein
VILLADLDTPSSSRRSADGKAVFRKNRKAAYRPATAGVKAKSLVPLEDPYGRATLVSGTNLATFQFAGYYEHANSGLNLFLCRDGYNSNLGRFIQRDAMGEDGGINLYCYVGNDSINAMDPFGLFSSEQCKAIKKVLERERKYGTTAAAILSGNTFPFSDHTLAPFNSTTVPNPNSAYGPIDLDWFTDITAASGIGSPLSGRIIAPAYYIVGKMSWTAIRALTGVPLGNSWPFQDAAETNALSAKIHGRKYSDLFPPDFLKKECPCQ